MSTFTASIIPAYEDISIDLGVSIQRASYLTSLQIAILGGAPLFWKPLSNRYGRRPIFLLSTILSLVCNVGCAKSPDYASMAACRALTAFFISPAAAIGSAVVTETFFKKERGRYMGIWTLMVTLGVPVGKSPGQAVSNDSMILTCHRSFDLWVCRKSRRIPLDILGPCNNKWSTVHPVYPLWCRKPVHQQ